MAPRFLIIGGSGLIGKRLRHALGADCTLATYCTRPFPGGVHFDAAGARLADRILTPGSAYTHAFVLQGVTNIDACARDPAGTARVNVAALSSVIDELVRHSIVPVFASSDAVFDGSRGGWVEDDPVCPILTYGAQKARVEHYLLGLGRPSLVVRIAKVVTSDPREPGLINEWLEELETGKPIRCARDQIFSPVDADDVAAALKALALRECAGIFHLGGPRAVTRLEFLEMLVDEASRYRRVTPRIIPCSLRDLPFAEPRPLDTSMSGAKIAGTLGMEFKDVREVCREAVRRRYGSSAVGAAAHERSQATQ